MFSAASGLSRPQKFATSSSSSERVCFSLRLEDPKKICALHLVGLTPAVILKRGQQPVAEVAELELAGMAELELEP